MSKMKDHVQKQIDAAGAKARADLAELSPGETASAAAKVNVAAAAAAVAAVDPDAAIRAGLKAKKWSDKEIEDFLRSK